MKWQCKLIQTRKSNTKVLTIEIRTSASIFMIYFNQECSAPNIWKVRIYRTHQQLSLMNKKDIKIAKPSKVNFDWRILYLRILYCLNSRTKIFRKGFYNHSSTDVLTKWLSNQHDLKIAKMHSKIKTTRYIYIYKTK